MTKKNDQIKHLEVQLAEARALLANSAQSRSALIHKHYESMEQQRKKTELELHELRTKLRQVYSDVAAREDTIKTLEKAVDIMHLLCE